MFSVSLFKMIIMLLIFPVSSSLSSLQVHPGKVLRHWPNQNSFLWEGCLHLQLQIRDRGSSDLRSEHRGGALCLSLSKLTRLFLESANRRRAARSAWAGLRAGVQDIRTRWQEQPEVLLLLLNPAELTPSLIRVYVNAGCFQSMLSLSLLWDGPLVGFLDIRPSVVHLSAVLFVANGLSCRYPFSRSSSGVDFLCKLQYRER